MSGLAALLLAAQRYLQRTGQPAVRVSAGTRTVDLSAQDIATALHALEGQS